MSIFTEQATADVTTTTGATPSAAFRELYRLDGGFTDIKPIGVVADGFRMNGHFGGSIVSGELAGATLEGVDYFRIRNDGVGVVTAHELVTLHGKTVAVEVHGLVIAADPANAPQPADIVKPGFSWPTAPYTIEASAEFITTVPEWEHLNRLVVAHTGSVDFVAGEIKVTAYRLD
jgi:hypothetical protein